MLPAFLLVCFRSSHFHPQERCSLSSLPFHKATFLLSSSLNKETRIRRSPLVYRSPFLSGQLSRFRTRRWWVSLQVFSAFHAVSCCEKRCLAWFLVRAFLGVTFCVWWKHQKKITSLDAPFKAMTNVLSFLSLLSFLFVHLKWYLAFGMAWLPVRPEASILAKAAMASDEVKKNLQRGCLPSCGNFIPISLSLPSLSYFLVRLFRHVFSSFRAAIWPSCF